MTPTAAAAVLGAGLEDAPIVGRVGETPVASDRLNVREGQRRIQYVEIKCALLSSAAPVPGRAPAHAGMPASRIVARDFAAPARSFRSNRAGRSNTRKNFLVITLAASSTASGSAGFRLRTRSR